MAHFTLPLILLSLLALTSTLSTVYSAKASAPAPSDFIKSSCRVTRYPDLCVDSLSIYASTIRQSPKQMARVALSLSLSKARSVKAYVTQMRSSKGLKKIEYQAVRDCVEEMGDSVDRLSTSIGELGHMGEDSEEGFIWHMSNVQTWVSAALTDENTCMDGFAGRNMDGELKAAIISRITSVAQVTSNALALVNRYADRH